MTIYQHNLKMYQHFSLQELGLCIQYIYITLCWFLPLFFFYFLFIHTCSTLLCSLRGVIVYNTSQPFFSFLLSPSLGSLPICRRSVCSLFCCLLYSGFLTKRNLIFSIMHIYTIFFAPSVSPQMLSLHVNYILNVHQVPCSLHMPQVQPLLSISLMMHWPRHWPLSCLLSCIPFHSFSTEWLV